MCGFAGFWSTNANVSADALTLGQMTDAIAHRGPDDSGAWFDSEAGIALGHRRLSIVDLSPAGHQPMASPSGRYVTIYNGEIYNHTDLRVELEATGCSPQWRGHSDTEVMLAAFEHWGVSSTLERLNGMFALAVWDRQKRILTLARDRLGEKPVFYGRMGDTLLFGSELKALTAHSAFERIVDRNALALFLRHNYVPAPHSIWHGIKKLLPGHYVEIHDGGHTVLDPVAYWDFRRVAAEGAANPLPDTPELVDDLEALLTDAVGRQMGADVPLGAFLSGGVDSSLIVALMQAQSKRPVRTFTIGFHEAEYNEAVHAKAVAEHLGTDHTELYVTASDALAVVPRLASIWDEPFSDSSQIPAYLISAITREHVTVSLSGDAGDELFGGYNRYVSGMQLWNAAERVPLPLRRAAAAGLNHPVSLKAVNAVMGLLPSRHRYLGLADRLPKIGHLLAETSPEGVYRRLVSNVVDPERLVLGGHEPNVVPIEDAPGFADFRQKMMYIDTLTYLPDDILVKVDRASMAVSLEARAPFLDYRVVEYAWRLPISAKIRDGRGKHILREILYRHVPKALIERPKMGFAVPIEQWLTGALRPWVEDLLDEERLRREGFFDAVKVRALWDEHLSGRRRWHNQLWSILMFQAWWAEHQPTGVARPVATGLPAVSYA